MIGTVGCQFRFCLDEKVAVLNKETGLFDEATKRIFTGPLCKLSPVYPIGSTTAKYYTAEVELDEPDAINPEYFNLKTGKPVSYTDAIMSLTKSSKHMLNEGQIAVAVTPDTLEAVKEALRLGFPKNRVNDALGLLNPANKVIAPIVQKDIVLDDIKFDESEINGIKDLNRISTAPVVVDDLAILLDEGVQKGIVKKKGVAHYDFGVAVIGPGKAKALAALTPELIAILKGEAKVNTAAMDKVGV